MKSRELFLIGIKLYMCLFICSAAIGEQLVINVSKNAYVDQSLPDNNFDGAEVLIAQRDPYGKKIYLEFNVSHLTEPISDITTLEFDYAGSYGRYGQAYLITGPSADNWQQSTITWNNAPANNTSNAIGFLEDAVYIGQVDITGYNEFGTVELIWDANGAKEKVVNQLNSGSRTATIAVSRNGDRSVQYHSKEAQGDIHPIRMVVELGHYGNPDITNDGIVDIQDLSIFTRQWLETEENGQLAADITGDGKVWLADYSILTNYWRKTPPLPLGLYSYPMSDAELIGAFDLDLPQLSQVKHYYEEQNYDQAISELAAYYRNRQGTHWWFDPHAIVRTVGSKSDLDISYDIMDGTWSQINWQDNGDPDWIDYNYIFMPRMYFMTSLGKGYWYSGTEFPAAYAYVKTLRTWINQVGPGSDYWGQMNTGIRMRSGWGDAFNYFLHSSIVTDRDLALHIKSSIVQLRYLRNNMVSNVPNHLAFARAGLYAGGVLFNELKEAQDWRDYAAQTTIEALTEDHLPDGCSLELSVGYSQFFLTDYLESIYDLAVLTGRENENYIQQIIGKCEQPADFFVRLMSPDRRAPSYNDNVGPDVVSLMQRLIGKYPGRQDFLWIATEGQQGSMPDYTSCFLPYSGYAAMRSGWARDDNYLGFDNALTGRTHCHMDKLNIVFWAYGRQIIFESEGAKNDNENIWSVYSQDTFSHNTGLVDNRPQRRNWGTPNPSQMPYQPLANVQWETTAQYDYAWGVYEDSYGMQGPSDTYPYSTGSNYYEGWVDPAHHYRKVFFLKPDIFIINDIFVTQDGQPHNYELRFNLDSVSTRVRNANWVTTIDTDKSNLEIIPLMNSGLTTNVISGQTVPQIIGWRVDNDVNAHRATTIQYLKSGNTAEFLTLLMPQRKGLVLKTYSVNKINDHNYQVILNDARSVTIQTSADPYAEISASFN